MSPRTSERRTIVVLLCLLGAAPACERREVVPRETTTRSGELATARSGADVVPVTPADAGDLVRDPDPQVPRATRAAEAPRTVEADARDRRFDPRMDAGRLSIIGAEDRERNLGLVREARDASADPAAASPAAPLAPQMGAGAVEIPPPSRTREGAGSPGAGGAPYQ